MDNYVRKFNSYDRSVIYDFRLGYGGIGDYLKFFMIILTECIQKNTRFYHKINNIEISKYIKLKHDIFNIKTCDIPKLNEYSIKRPFEYYNDSTYRGDIRLSEVFYFSDQIKCNVENIISVLPDKFISIHLRMGDKFLETDKKYVFCKHDTRKFSEESIQHIITNNSDKNILFFCDNNEKKQEIKTKYDNILVTNATIGHTSLSNTTSRQIIDSITEFYILTNSEQIHAVSKSGFSEVASKFNGSPLIKYY